MGIVTKGTSAVAGLEKIINKCHPRDIIGHSSKMEKFKRERKIKNRPDI